MTITLRPDQEHWIADAKVEVEEKIERAFAQFDRGEFRSAEESRAEMQRRKSEWLANRQSS